MKGFARGGGGDGEVDCCWWSGGVGGGGGEVGEEVRDAGEWGAGFEERVLRADFGGPFVVGDG